MEKKKKSWIIPAAIAGLIVIVIIAIISTAMTVKKKNAAPVSTVMQGASDSYSGSGKIETGDTADLTGLDSTTENNLSTSDLSSSFLNAENDRKIRKTVSMKVITDAVENDAEAMQSKCEDENGYVESSYIEKDTATITFQIPKDQADVFIYWAKKRFDIDSFSESREDITSDYVDNDSRLSSKKKALLQYQELLKKAKTVEDVIAVQGKIDEIEADLESYESTKKTYDQSLDYETITVLLSNEKKIGSDTAGDRMMETLKNCAENFMIFLINLIFLIPAFLIIIFLCAEFYRLFHIIKNRKSAKREISANAAGPTVNEAKKADDSK